MFSKFILKSLLFQFYEIQFTSFLDYKCISLAR